MGNGRAEQSHFNVKLLSISSLGWKFGKNGILHRTKSGRKGGVFGKFASEGLQVVCDFDRVDLEDDDRISRRIHEKGVKGAGVLMRVDLPISGIGEGEAPGSVSFRIGKIGFLFSSQLDAFSATCQECGQGEGHESPKVFEGFDSKPWSGCGHCPFRAEGCRGLVLFLEKSSSPTK